MPDELFVYDVSADQAHCLNQTAASVWRASDGTRTVSELAQAFGTTTEPAHREGLVLLAIEQLQEHGLMAQPVDLAASGHSRRDLIKHLGLASAVALPIVASLAVPGTVLAQGSCSCVSPGDCATQTSCPNSNNCNGSGLCAP
jgi:hypothetical protein